MLVLGIETSCDDTGLALYDTQAGLLAHRIFNQTLTHIPYGGVVPELASRDHSGKLIPLLQALLKETQRTPSDLEGIAYTAGPGLIGALLVGATFAKALGYALNIPTIGIHHMEGHLLAPMLEDNPPAFPFLALLVSGGHTLLVDVKALGDYQVLGESLDDAAGEAFDKTAKLLGLPYPGGPELAKLAQQGQPNRYQFPRPMTKKPGFDFSFSGLKTAVLHTWKNCPQTEQDKADIAYAFQEAVVETLFIKCRKALQQSKREHLVVSGGVGANQQLRERLKTLPATLYFPRLEFCTDNGAMIAYVGAKRLANEQDPSSEILVYPRWPLDSLVK